MKKYDPETFTYGFELELGDVPKSLEVPSNLGKWEHAETDVINLKPPYAMRCCDPLGIDPPFGGEINTKPTRTIKEQVDRIQSILNFFREKGYEPTTNCVSHNHHHVHVPGLREDVEGLKKLTSFIKKNQKLVVEYIYDFKPNDCITKTGTTSYFKFDGGRLQPDWLSDNIINKTTSFEDFVLLHCCGKDGVSRGRPFRYAINTYCLKHINTIEFRFFRHSFDEKELTDSFEFIKDFLDRALNDGPDYTMSDLKKYSFPKFKYDYDQCVAWQKTKYGSERGKKEREFCAI